MGQLAVGWDKQLLFRFSGMRLFFSAIGLVFILASACDSPGVLVRRADIPPPATLAALRAYYDTTAMRECDLPAAATNPDWGIIAVPNDGLELQLPPGWRVYATRDSTPLIDAEAELRGPNDDWIQLARRHTGAVRNQWMARNEEGDPAQGILCQVDAGSAGSIWILYAPDSIWTSPGSPGEVTVKRHVGLGDMITPAGIRYQGGVGATTAAERDRLVRILADAALRTADDTGATPGIAR